MRKLLAAVIAAFMLASMSTMALAEGKREDAPRPKLQVPKELKEKGDSLNNLSDEGRKLKEQLKDNKCHGKKNEDSKKHKTDTAKDKKDNRKELTDTQRKQLTPYFEQVKALRGQMKTRHNALKDCRTDLETALASKDNAKAGQLMDKMIELKKAQNSDLKKLVEIKEKIKAVIDG